MTENPTPESMGMVEGIWIKLRIENPAFTHDDNLKFAEFRRRVALALDRAARKANK